MRCLVLILCSLMLAGCPHSGILKGSGDSAQAPVGFADYCLRHPERAECGGTK